MSLTGCPRAAARSVGNLEAYNGPTNARRSDRWPIWCIYAPTAQTGRWEPEADRRYTMTS